MNNAVKSNKKVPDNLSEFFYSALSYFPELSKKRVLVHETFFKGIQHSSRAYPPILSLCLPKSKWLYTIVVNKNKKINDLFYNLSSEKKVGLLAHELSHLSFYSELSRLGVIIFSIKYALSKKFVRRIEKETDLRVIERGAGKGLFMERIELFKFLKDNPCPDIEDIYLRPAEILSDFKKHPNLYPQKDLEECINKLELFEVEAKVINFFSSILLSRRIKHSLKIILAFVPEFLEMFYIIIIKRKHLK